MSRAGGKLYFHITLVFPSCSSHRWLHLALSANEAEADVITICLLDFRDEIPYPCTVYSQFRMTGILI